MSFGDFDIVVIVFLILINGLFSMSEIAIISARKARLQRLAEEGDVKAQNALELANSPNLFLSTAQIGITLVGVMSGVFGGATVAHRLAGLLSSYPMLRPYSETIAVVVVVLVLSYVSLVIGELVPKRLALNSPERIASLSAGPMRWLSIAAAPVVRLLSVSTDLALRLLRVRPSTGPPFTEEEIRAMIGQATTAGVFEQTEQDLVERVFRLGDRSVGGLMTPRQKISWIDINDSADKVRRKVAMSNHSRFPVCNGRLGNILGIVHVRDLFTHTAAGQAIDLRCCIQKPLFVVESTHALKVMELFRDSGMQVAMVIDEYGTIEGLVTINDVLEAIIGSSPSEDQSEEPRVVRRDDGSWLMDGTLPIGEVKVYLDIRKLPGERAGNFQTLGGFVMNYLKRVPRTADHFECCGWRFEVVDMDRHRVDKVFIEAVDKESPEPSE